MGPKLPLATPELKRSTWSASSRMPGVAGNGAPLTRPEVFSGHPNTSSSSSIHDGQLAFANASVRDDVSESAYGPQSGRALRCSGSAAGSRAPPAGVHGEATSDGAARDR